ncbi:hypothetical protein FA15DRAFT_695654 [Coprinopsis marcescibilis]|uniref:Uncharacterized protein n=1 Tax=Coprinopsis marcescibilis TaxID=230819 RepID=A0A5C3KPS6_COPMA|nr:hypothetical protein FA15DRAFT_695654 [Coprinopsis marcescibilis]
MTRLYRPALTSSILGKIKGLPPDCLMAAQGAPLQADWLRSNNGSRSSAYYHMKEPHGGVLFCFPTCPSSAARWRLKRSKSAATFPRLRVQPSRPNTLFIRMYIKLALFSSTLLVLAGVLEANAQKGSRIVSTLKPTSTDISEIKDHFEDLVNNATTSFTGATYLRKFLQTDIPRSCQVQCDGPVGAALVLSIKLLSIRTCFKLSLSQTCEYLHCVCTVDNSLGFERCVNCVVALNATPSTIEENRLVLNDWVNVYCANFSVPILQVNSPETGGSAGNSSDTKSTSGSAGAHISLSAKGGMGLGLVGLSLVLDGGFSFFTKCRLLRA